MEAIAMTVREQGWQQTIQEAARSGQNIKDRCMQKGIAQSTLYRWKQRLLTTVLSCNMMMTVYGRMFRPDIFAAIAPILLPSFAGQPSSNIGHSFLKSCTGVCLERAVIALACVIFPQWRVRRRLSITLCWR